MGVYVTVRQVPSYSQITLEEILDGYIEASRFEPTRNAPSGTITRYCTSLKPEFIQKFDIVGMINMFQQFNQKHEELFSRKRESLYTHFEIDKSSIDPVTGTFKKRPIDAPCPQLKLALNELKLILEEKCGALYHTNAFAYIKNRCAVDSMRRHQANHSHWFLKTDFSNFFGNTTEVFLNNMMSMLFPFSEIYKNDATAAIIRKSLSLCFLRGGLPQGSPISPLLTNIMMIPIDHRFANTLREKNGKHYIYTRYADDILISSKVGFNHQEVVDYMNNVLSEFNAPFGINPDKTRYASGNGHNFHLGVILNENNEITVGYKKKQMLRAMINEFIRDHVIKGLEWPVNEIQVMHGLYEYCKSVEPEYWRNVIDRFNAKYNINVIDKMRESI